MGPQCAVTAIGAGVIGLTCAHALREAGYRVTVIAADQPRVSDVAGGLWLPYAVGDSADVMRWALEQSRGLRPAASLPGSICICRPTSRGGWMRSPVIVCGARKRRSCRRAMPTDRCYAFRWSRCLITSRRWSRPPRAPDRDLAG